MIRTAVIGASGYSGTELLKILSLREDVIVDHVIANSNAGKYVSEINPTLSCEPGLKYEKYEHGILNSIDVVFISLPSGESMKIVPDILSAGTKIIDIGGDFRLKNPAQYEKYYHLKHISNEYLNESVYGLTELYQDDIANARLVANPGCYSTGILLSIVPAIKRGIISLEGIVINSLSGVSGAGKKDSLEYSFTELNENVRAYKLLDHQHVPEIEQILNIEAGDHVSFSFIPHLVPLTRGIYTTIVADLKYSSYEHSIYDIYKEFYSTSSFVRIRKNVPQVKDVVQTNYCDIHIKLDMNKNKLIIISIIDNLLKGAAGQAVQNMNIMFDLPETYGFIRKEKQYV